MALNKLVKAHLTAVITAFLTALLVIALVAGCGLNQWAQDNPRTARAVTTYATLKVVKGDPARADRVVEITENVMAYAEDVAHLTVDALIVAIRSEIRWNRLDMADTVMINELLELLREELTRYFGGVEIPPDMALTVNVLGEWVISAAQMVPRG